MGWRPDALAAAVLSVAAAAPARTEEPVPVDWRIERVDREFKAPADAALAIWNPWGDVRVRAGDAGRLLVHAVVQRHAEDPREVAIETVAEGGGLRLEVTWARDDASSPAGWAHRRVDLAVEVPELSALRLRTEGGLIEVKGHAGPLEARSTGGDLRLRVAAGPLDARTERGDILVVLAAEAWSQSARLEAPSGDVEVQVPARTDASLLLETQGALTTDFSLEVEHLGPLTKRGRARLGRGGSEIALLSRRGDLRILLRPPAATAP